MTSYRFYGHMIEGKVMGKGRKTLENDDFGRQRVVSKKKGLKEFLTFTILKARTLEIDGMQ